MKYIIQFFVIILVTFIGEILNHLIPLPIPASIYGIVIMFLALQFKIIKLSWVRETGKFLISIMPIMFIPSAVGLINSWDVLRPAWVAYVVIATVTTILVMGAAGKATDIILRKKEGKKNG